jgi:CDP-paratose 2-epimerase
MCRERAGRSLSVGSDPSTNPADVPCYVTDNSLVTKTTGWAPRRSLTVLLDDIFEWLQDHRVALEPRLSGQSVERPAPHITMTS